jgi:tRNA A37 N6-isopentenylltransferase MiaA
MPILPDSIFIVGQTAVGKSAVALELARKIEGEVVSADSI